MKNSAIETVLAFAVLFVTGWFLFHVFTIGQSSARQESYALSAQFFTAPGVKTGDKVLISGIPVGQVSRAWLDPESYFAVVEMEIDNRYRLPDDSALAIQSGGLTGGSAVSIQVGKSATMLEPGAEITRTHEPVSVTDQIGRAIFSGGFAD